eukprot:365130-Chlamydomonas_euryale.AAC.33
MMGFVLRPGPVVAGKSGSCSSSAVQFLVLACPAWHHTDALHARSRPHSAAHTSHDGDSWAWSWTRHLMQSHHS